jgi:anti-anti-sigma regulatory factor
MSDRVARTTEAISELTEIIAGSLGITQATPLRDRFVQLLQSGVDVHIDCSEVGEIDAAGAQPLFALSRELTRQGRALRLVALPEPSAATLRKSGFGALIESASVDLARPVAA